jgi:hypothetical protein
VTFLNKRFFYGEELLAPSSNPQTGGAPLFDCWLPLIQSIVASTVLCVEAVSSIRNPRTHRGMVTGTHRVQEKSGITALMKRVCLVNVSEKSRILCTIKESKAFLLAEVHGNKFSSHKVSLFNM